MEIIDKTTEEWKPGDVLKKGTSFALVVEGLDSCFFFMNFTPNDPGTFSLNEGNHWGVDDNLKYLKDFHNEWHKVNAKLVIE